MCFGTSKNGRSNGVAIVGVTRVLVDGAPKVGQLNFGEPTVFVFPLVYQHIAGLDVYSVPCSISEQVKVHAR